LKGDQGHHLNLFSSFAQIINNIPVALLFWKGHFTPMIFGGDILPGVFEAQMNSLKVSHAKGA
jgi:hypothetical protein